MISPRNLLGIACVFVLLALGGFVDTVPTRVATGVALLLVATSLVVDWTNRPNGEPSEWAPGAEPIPGDLFSVPDFLEPPEEEDGTVIEDG